MNSIFEKLQSYFNNTSEEQIEKDWSDTAPYDVIGGPSVDEFLKSSCLFAEVDLAPPNNNNINFVNINKNPSFTSDFLF